MKCRRMTCPANIWMKSRMSSFVVEGGIDQMNGL